MNVLPSPRRILFDVLHGAFGVILREKDVFVATWRKRDSIENNSRPAAQKAAYPAVARLVDTNAVTLVRESSSTMMEPLNGPVPIIFRRENIRPAPTGIWNGQPIENRATGIIARYVEVVRSVNGDGFR